MLYIRDRLFFIKLACIYHPRSKGGIVVSSVRLRVCLSVCLSVNTVTPEPLEISSHFQGIIVWSKGQTSWKMAIQQGWLRGQHGQGQGQGQWSPRPRPRPQNFVEVSSRSKPVLEDPRTPSLLYRDAWVVI